MSDGSISQDEIDALLAGVDMGGMGTSSASSSKTFSDAQKTALNTFFGNIKPSVKSNYDSMTGSGISVDGPEISVMTRDGLLKSLPEMVVATVVDFSGGLSGDHIFLQSPELAGKLVSLVNNEPGAELDDMALSVLSETISQHVGAELTEMEKNGISGAANQPAETVHVPKAMVRYPQQDFAVFQYTLGVDGGSYPLWEIMQYSAAVDLAKAFGAADPAAAQPAAGPAASAAASAGQQAAAAPNMGMNMNAAAVPGGFAMPGMAAPGMGMPGMAMPGYGMQAPQPGSAAIMPGMTPNVQPVQFPSLQNTVTPQEQGNIGLIMDVYMEMTVELGRTRKVIKDILGMGEGTIIELDKLAGEPVDILVNHKPIAKGEVVVIDENFGVRVTEILSPSERISDV